VTAKPLHIALDVPAQFESAAAWAIRHIATVWGVAVRISGEGARDPDIVYSAAPASGDIRAWRFNAHCYDGLGSFSAHAAGERMIWSEGELVPDLVGGIFRLLTLQDEADVDPGDRNQLGIFNTPSLPARRRAVVGRPMVEHHIDSLWDQAKRVRPDLTQRPRWPSAKRWACVITHDTDAVSLGRPRELLYNAAKLLIRREPMRLQMLRTGLRHRASPMQDPSFGFPRWRALEAESALTSAFYLFVLPRGVRRHFHDCRSSVNDPGIDIRILRDMADSGWEFGLHASINARHHPRGLRESRGMLETLLDRPIQGLRHHYWALDWERPWRTFRQHADAGFRYDTSLAWRDVPGFRAGTSLPFRPFDRDSKRPIELWEVPTAIQDGHLLEGAPGDVLDRATAMIDETRSVGGVLVLNWHTETANQQFMRRGFLDVFQQVIDHVRAEPDVWFTTTSRLLDHWEARAGVGHRRAASLSSQPGSPS
jgi:hypothetical protein